MRRPGHRDPAAAGDPESLARIEIIDVEFGHDATAADHADLPFQLADRFRAVGGPAVMTSIAAFDADRIATALVCGRAELVSVPFEAVPEATG